MTILEIWLLVVILLQFIAIYFLNRENKGLKNTVEIQNTTLFQDQKYIQTLKAKIIEAEKKAKLSNDVLEIMHDMKEKGAIFEVTRIDRNDIFFHNGSVYR